MDKIILTQHDQGLGHVGGGAYLNNLALWPTNPKTGELLTPLVTSTERFYSGDRCIPAGMATTVFIAAQHYQSGGFNAALQRRYTVSEQSQLQEQINNGFARVILHDLAPEPIVPDNAPLLLTQAFINFEAMSEDEWDEEIGGEYGGIALSKAGGSPSWLQDPVYEPNRYMFHLQLLDADIAALNPEHEGAFADGIGYVFIDLQARRGKEGDEAGFFFIQHT
ncbi:hypothetical protein [Pseudomonas sp. SMV7]|uniref:hypothetical protein n=1 Tax=Pseudomonas sp. SMV7 TaxID=3390194 RepID=UPI003F861C5B